MKIWQIPRGFGPIEPAEADIPEPGYGEVLLRMKAVSLNFRDLLMAAGKYNPRLSLPLIPLSDGVGMIEKLGPGVQNVKVGERVCPIFSQSWLSGDPDDFTLKNTLGGPLPGTLCQYMVVSAHAVIWVPAHLSDEEAATLPCAALTAWSAMAEYGNVKPGQSVLVLGTGGVSVFAIQFAAILGARIIVTSGDSAKLKKAEELEAHDGINYRDTPDWDKEARKLTGGTGVDHVIEVGGAGTLEKSIRSVRSGGTISLIGVLAGNSAPFDLTPVLMRNIKIQGILVGSRQAFENMNQAISVHSLHPVIDKVFAFDEARDAFEYLQASQHMGKVCIKID